MPEIQALLTAVNNDVYRRVTDLVVDDMAADGKGAPPLKFAVIVMGSGGRGENFIFPDQDNGLILADRQGGTGEAAEAWFLDFAYRLTQALDTVGFPLCRGDVMATNPVWRKPLAQWKSQFGSWVADGTAESLRYCDIVSDFRAVWGAEDLAQTLRRHMLDTVKANRGD